MFFWQDAILNLHGPRSDYEPHLQSEPNRPCADETFARADTEFPRFITTTWKKTGRVCQGTSANIYFKKYYIGI